ncbi:MAG TPA: pitrilysin family protein [Fibrobacteraceae bacterium]|nr:pitrilysin family protein [Fibrobacteraceae bacterium]
MKKVCNLSFAAIFAASLWGPAMASGIDLKVQRVVLDNGLTVLMHENAQSPTVACRLFYKTGSVHETVGNNGIAHMLEHMLFKGTRKVGITDSIADSVFMAREDSLQALIRAKGLQGDSVSAKKLHTQYDSVLNEHRKLFVKDELWETYLKAGGTGLNAYTTDQVTAYHVSLPRNKVELFLWLESDRMQHAVLREFYPERDVVREERRMRYDDSPTGRYFESLEAMFYETFPYRNPTIGYPSEIAQLTREKAEQHYRSYYKPNNAILVFAGDFHADTLLPLIRKYFGSIPRGKDFEPMTVQEPEQAGEKRLVVRRDDAKPRVDMLFHTPGIPDEDLYALDVMESVLNGRAGRLYRRLVEKEQVALSTDAGNAVRKYMSSFELEAVLREGESPQKAEDLLWAELDRLKNEPVSDRELQKVRNLLYATKARALSDMETVASMLAYNEYYGDYTMVNRWLDEVSKVTPAQVQAVARKYFQRKLVTIGWLIPEDKK